MNACLRNRLLRVIGREGSGLKVVLGRDKADVLVALWRECQVVVERMYPSALG